MTSMRSFATRTAALATLLTFLVLPTAPLAAAPEIDSGATWELSWSALAQELARLGDRIQVMVGSSENDPDPTGGGTEVRPIVDPNGLTASPELEAPSSGLDATPVGG